MEKDIFKDKFLSEEISKEKEFVYNKELFNNNLRIINIYCNNKIINTESIIPQQTNILFINIGVISTL